MKSYKQTLGNIGETIAASYLQKRGFHIIERNFRAQHGEIDIVASQKDVLIFVEVKTRSTDRYGLPEEAVTYRKRKEIARTVAFYIHQHPMYGDWLYRFDVIAIMTREGVLMSLNHIQDVSLQ